jgi:hypothetical protein
MRESPTVEKVEKYGAYIEKEMARLMTRAEDIVEFLRDDCPLDRERVSLRELLAELESRTWVDCRLSGVSFESTVEGKIELEADRERLLRSLESLFRNSREAMTDGGAFSIAARLTAADEMTITSGQRLRAVRRRGQAAFGGPGSCDGKARHRGSRGDHSGRKKRRPPRSRLHDHPSGSVSPSHTNRQAEVLEAHRVTVGCVEEVAAPAARK